LETLSKLKPVKYLLLYLILFFCSCSPKTDEVQMIYNDRSEIINLFASKSVMRSRGKNIILFYTHNKSKTNKYFFEINNSQLQFTNDSIEYAPDLLQLKNERGNELYKQELISKVKMFLDKMDEFNIRDISSDMAGVGISLKIYMKSKGVILYVPNSQSVPGPRFKDYINSMQKLDENWYYTMNE